MMPADMIRIRIILILDLFVDVAFTGHRYIATDRQCPDREGGLLESFFEDPRTHADGVFKAIDTKKLGHDQVSEFMDGDDYRQCKQK